LGKSVAQDIMKAGKMFPFDGGVHDIIGAPKLNFVERKCGFSSLGGIFVSIQVTQGVVKRFYPVLDKVTVPEVVSVLTSQSFNFSL
jgi:hypothetical protein